MDKIELDTKISLEDLILQYLEENKQVSIPINQIPTIKHCMKLAVSKALVLASEKATTYTETFCSPHSSEWKEKIDRKSILGVEKLVV